MNWEPEPIVHYTTIPDKDINFKNAVIEILCFVDSSRNVDVSTWTDFEKAEILAILTKHLKG